MAFLNSNFIKPKEAKRINLYFKNNLSLMQVTFKKYRDFDQDYMYHH